MPREKIKFALRMSPETQQLVKEMCPRDNCQTQNEFIERAIRFYAGYISGQEAAAHLSNYVRYVATRDGAEKLTPDKVALPATKKQQAMVERLLRDFPMSRGMFEYEDYQSSPTHAAALEFITRAIETAALEWLEKAAKLKNPYAEYQVAKRILSEPSVKSERINQAMNWLTHAAETGLDYAQYALGKQYRDGGPVEQDMTQAVIWFSQAAEQGNPYAMYALGKLHLEADNPAAVLRWFQRSAELGNQFAQYRLGKLLLTSDGVQKDATGAIRWLTESAKQGNQYAQYALGKLYLLGKDIPQDREDAVRWFTLAAGQGNEYARYFLDHMDAPSLFDSATRLLHHMGNVFRDQAPPPTGGISFVDSKLRRKIREKKIAMGHKPDDHEEQIQQFR